MLATIICPVAVQLLRDAASVYGDNGLIPATPGSVGIDLRACIEKDILITSGERAVFPTGLAIAPQQPGIAGFVYSRSGLGAVKGLVVAQGVGVIDPDYRGEISVFLLNTSPSSHTIERGERIAQIIFQPYFQANFLPTCDLGETNRGHGGFGHTGK